MLSTGLSGVTLGADSRIVTGSIAPVAVAPKDLPALTGLGLSKTKELLLSGEIASIRCGRRRVVPLASVYEWLERRLAGSKDAA